MHPFNSQRIGIRVALFAVMGLIGVVRGDQAPSSQPAVAALPVQVAMTDPAVRLIGRFDTSNPAAPKCSWSASSVSIHFKGSQVNVDLADGPNARYEIVVDGKATGVLKALHNEHRYAVATDLPDTEHTVTLIKCGEPCFGTSTFQGFELPAGADALPAAKGPEHRIELIGDSICTGYGNEAKSRDEHFSATTQNSYDTFGAITARELDAEYTCIAWSGRKMCGKDSIPEIYDRALPQKADSGWDFSKWVPQVVVIELGSNDLDHAHPDEATWIAGYEAFLKHVRTLYPEATIYCTNDPIMWGDSVKTLHEYLTKIVSDSNTAGDARVHLFEFAMRDGDKEGYGADWHPSVKTHRVMARKFIDVVAHDLGWSAGSVDDSEPTHPVN